MAESAQAVTQTQTSLLRVKPVPMTNREKFQTLLHDLFQFDCADLDFGIYRILNYKRDVIEKFISTDLPELISEELNRDALADQSQAATELAETAEEIVKTLGKDALDADGNLVHFQETEIGKKYLSLQGKAAAGRGREALEATIFNHLYTFFSRYYQDGDFISKRRYSKRQKYAIPYNGEEVYLHWANHDQYYVKTAEHFHDYTFTSQGVTVHFTLTAANVEQNNVKGDKRFFLPRVKEIDWREKTNELVIPFEYRPLTEQGKVTYGTKNQQDKIIAEACEAIPKKLKNADKALAAIIAERRKDSDNQPVTFLEHHLRQYTRKNTSDFFIHKDLKGFLSRELDFYLKNEVLNLDEMEAAGEGRSEGWFQVLRVINAVGSRIIDFLDQIESFQKMLWEKRKFVTETQYCITVGTIDERFYPDIAACDAQWDEWKELYHIDEKRSDLFTIGKSKEERRIGFLKAHPALVIDTQYLSSDTTDRLLSTFTDLDELTDGVVVHSENFQAMTLLREKYGSSVKCIYIDPPYNTKKDRFPYKDGYKSSSWLAMMNDRLTLAGEYLRQDGVFWSSIDWNEYHDLEVLLERTFGRHNRIGEIIWRNARDNNPTRIATEHEYILCYARNAPDTEQVWKNDFADAKELLLAAYYDLKKRGLSISEIQREIRNFIRDNRSLLAEVDRYKFVDEHGIYTGSQSVHNPHPGGYEYEILHPDTGKRMRLPATGYRFPEETMRRDYIEKDRLLYGPDENRIVQIKMYLDDYKDSLRSVVDLDGRLGVYALNALFGSGSNFYENPKPPQLLDRLLSFSSTQDTIVLDFFAGSGTTAQSVMEIARRAETNMRFILVEMDKSVDTVILPRIKKLMYAPEWKNGHPESEAKHGPSIVKLSRLESYEDTLNNIAFDEGGGQGALQFDDYLLKYMLEWETRKSETLLNVEQLAKPFSYKLTVVKGEETIESTVDIPETFNYLLGLHVRTRKVYDDDGRRYLVYHGRIDHRHIAVIWRETEGWEKEDLERDKKFVAEQKLADRADEVFVNGDSFIPNAKALEPVFKARMFAPVEA